LTAAEGRRLSDAPLAAAWKATTAPSGDARGVGAVGRAQGAGRLMTRQFADQLSLH